VSDSPDEQRDDSTGMSRLVRHQSVTFTQEEREAVSRLKPAQVEDAAIWLIRMRDRRASRVHGEFERWLASDPLNQAAFERAEAIFGALEAPAAVVAERDARHDGRSAFAPPPLASRRRAWRHMPRWMSIAALLALVVAIGLIVHYGARDPRGAIVTAAGETRSVALPDGSTVTLNTDTSLSYRVDGPTRRVSLDRGEAFFDVAHDAAHPFVVEDDETQVEVIGTRFNVKRTATGTSVHVLAGRVRVTPLGRADGLTITDGQAAVVTLGHVRDTATDDVHAALAWRDRRAVFYRAPLADVVAELQRYRRAPAVIINPRLRASTLSAVFDTRRPDDAIATAAKTVRAKSARLPGGVLIVY
jgi:transmembrane sensor